LTELSRLDQPDVIDLVSENAAGDEIIVHIIATTPWDPSGHDMLKLQAKLKTAVAFIADGQLTRDYPEIAGKRTRIHIDTLFSPGEAELRLIEAVRTHWCKPDGIELTWSSRDPA